MILYDATSYLSIIASFLGVSRSQHSRCEGQGEKHNDLKGRFKGGSWDVLISNPPYISPAQFGNGSTARRVRVYEPKLALIPPVAIFYDMKELREPTPEPTLDPSIETGVDFETGFDTHADTFYPRLITISSLINAKLSIFECGDPQQASRVAELAGRYPGAMSGSSSLQGSKDNRPGDGYRVEIWRLNDDSGYGDGSMFEVPRATDHTQYDKGARAVVVRWRPP